MSTIRRHWLPLGLFTLLALIMTWPLVSRIATHVPGSDTWAYDEYTFIWSMWWLKHSLIDGVGSIFFSPNIFYPLGMELILYSYNLMAAILALPVGLASNWALASNLSLLFSIVMSGYGAYLLALWLLRMGNGYSILDIKGSQPISNTQYHLSNLQLAAFIAGIIYAFASNRMIYLALGHYNIHSVQWLPFFLLYLLRIMRQPSRHNALMAGFFGALNLLVDMQYGVFMAFFALCLLLTKPLRPLLFRDTGRGRRWLALLLAVATALVLTLPYFWETVKAFLDADFLLSGWGDALKLSADLKGWFTPTALHPLWGSDWVRSLREVQEGTGPFNDINTVFLGFATTALALLGVITAWRKLRGWIVATVLSALFTLGPLLQIGGKIFFDFDDLSTGIPMPFLLLHYIPFVKGNRTANRWSIVLMLCLAVLAAWGAFWLLTKIRQRSPDRRLAYVAGGVAAILAVFILFEHAAVPLPTTDARIPPAIAELATLEDGAVLQIPMGWRNSFGVLGVERTQAQYYMSAHEKPILSGNTSRNPAIKFDYFGRLPLVTAITRQEFGVPPDDGELKAAREQAGDLLKLWGVRYLMLLPPVEGRLPYADTYEASQQLALDLIPHSDEPIIDDGTIRIYGVDPGEPLPLDVDFGTGDSAAWRGAGWGDDERDVGGAPGIWVTDTDAMALFRSDDSTPRELAFRAKPFTWPNAPAQTLTVLLNGREIGQVEMADDWQEYSFEIVPQPGINHIEFQFSRADSPRNLLGQAMIGTTGVRAPLNIEAHSFDFAFVSLYDGDGNEIPASFGRRGYNVTVLDPESGEIEDMLGFDTVANAFEVEALVEYLNDIPAGKIVILSTSEGAGEFVSPELVAAMRRLGSDINDPAEVVDQAHVLIGVAGAAPGTAAEQIDVRDAYLLVEGDFRTLAAAFDWLHIE
ncbi:MAG: hypothetical protein J5I90_07695 [Caldilineales bacterium]|nr:hypothetical protein [Caldilineales bacterium]